MSIDIRDLLPLYALGELDAEQASAVEQAIAADPTLAAELDAYLAIAPTATPGADLEARLMASVGGGKHESFATRLSTLLDVTVDRAREILGLVERKASWVHPLPGIHLVHFQAGPAYATADCGFVRIEPGCTFPTHTHRGEEVSIVLEGSMHDIDGKILSAGDERVLTDGSEHHLVAGPEGVLYVARATHGIEIAGQRQ
jgi:putative transcriptional regulator